MAKRDQDRERKEKILRESRKRFRRAQDWEKTARMRFLDDYRFCEGDSDNLYQWPEAIRTRMESNHRAMLTINKTKQHCLDVENDARQQRVAIKIRATGDGASAESAQVFAGLVRHIEYISNAATAYQTGLRFTLRGGWGYWRIVTDYAGDDSFDQEIFIRRVKDPLSVYLDPDIVEFDGSDAKFGFVFTDRPREEIEQLYPQFKDRVPQNTTYDGGESWVLTDTIRVAEYFRRLETPDELLAYKDPDSGQQKVQRASELPDELVKALKKLPDVKTRKIRSHKVEWFLIVGDEIVEEREWPGAYIPIVRCIGDETVIDGQLDRKSHTRPLKDAQRLFNYNAAGFVEFGALQSKSPYISPADAIEGYETYWETANTENHAVLPFNHMDDEGNPIPAPQRQQPPSASSLFLEGMNAAAEWMRMVSGQYQADMGAPSNERSGRAIDARARQGDNATFHFLDHQSIAIRFTGKILLDLIPKVYDTERVLKIRGEDGSESQIRIDPAQNQALQTVQQDRDEVVAIFNPAVGKYEVESDVGPAFQTQRQEAWNAYVQILSQNKDLVHLIGDLAFKCADFPGAEEIAERLKRMVPSQALQDGPPPELLAAQQQIQALHGLLQKVAQKLADKTAEHLNDQEKNAISAYDSQTKRLAALKDALAADPEGLVQLVRQVILEAESTSAPALMPALQPTHELTAEQMAAPPMVPPQMQLAGPAPNASPQDVTAGPAAPPSGGTPAAP